MTFKTYETNTYTFYYPCKRIDISMIFNAIGAKLQQSGLKSALSFAAPAGFWQGIGGENRVISIIERGLFYIKSRLAYGV